MRTITSLALAVCSCATFAVELPALPSHATASPHKLFLLSQPDHQDFDSWKIDGGYAYSIRDNVDIFVGAQASTEENGFLSGVSYQLTPRVSLQSTLRTTRVEETETNNDTVFSAEVSSRMRLTENIDVHATLDHQEWQNELELGLGFRF
ncbi:hypothetical protein [Vibrio sonorensis]|uniref:hypothetical protein n=1 Tax=Vibrio sonorensis TaxID=1004316 RepID=UPI0008DA45DD|nr:hypothetical protein [Vibrio sonorensis]